MLAYGNAPAARGVIQLLHEGPFHSSPDVLRRVEDNLTTSDFRSIVASLPVLNEAFETYAVASLMETPRQVLESWIDQFGGSDEFVKLLGVADLSDSMGDFLNRSILGTAHSIERRGKTLRTGEAVSLLTLHASKGLEFPVVFICGVEDGLIPMEREDSDVAEERRLLYVGMTRAKDELILLSAKARSLHGVRTTNQPSVFLKGISDEWMVKEEGVGRRSVKEEQLSLF